MKKSLFSTAVAIAIASLAAACSGGFLPGTSDSLVMDKAEIWRDPVRAISLSVKDAYEQDDSQSAAKLIGTAGIGQERNFYDDATDWIKFSAVSGTAYTIESWILGSADTVLYLYDGSSILASNDDKASGDYGSKITWTAPSTKTYYIKAYSYGGRKGTNRGYTISVGSGGGGGGDIVLPQPAKQWTVLVYLDADNNLSSYGASDVAEMKLVGSNADMNVVVLWDSASSEHGYYYIEAGKATLLRDVGEVNMGAAQTAKDFLDYAAANFPADKFMWVFWNHGGAVDRDARGVAWDDTNGGDHLSEVEQKDIMAYGVQKIGKPFEAIGFDACLMATGEIFYQYRGMGKYMAASEQTEPGDGWDYRFLNVIKTTPSCDGNVATKAIFDYYKAWYSSMSDVTFSTVDLSYGDDIGAALGAFGAAARVSGVAGSTYRTLAANLPDFSGYTKDIVAYMNAVLASTAVPQSVKDKATIVKNLVTGSLVKNNWTGSTWTGKAFGAAITLKADTTVYSYLDICVDTEWDEFLTFAGF